MDWNKDIALPWIMAVAAILVIVAIALGYIAAGKHLGLSNDTEVHVRDVGSSDANKKNKVCIQVTTRARDPQTHETLEFPTPCDVPSSWEIIK